MQLCKTSSIFVPLSNKWYQEYLCSLFFFSLRFIFCTFLIVFSFFFMYSWGLSFCVSFINLLINELTLFKCVAVYSSDYKSVVSQTALFSFNGEYSMHALKFYSFVIIMPSPVPRSNAAFEKWKSQYTLTLPAHKTWMLRKWIQQC